MADRFPTIYVYGSAVFTEAAAVPGGAPGAGFGSFWVKNDAPSTPQFTDSGGASHNLLTPTTTTAHYFTEHAYDPGNTNLNYMRFAAEGDDGGMNYFTWMIAMFDGELRTVKIYSNTGSGSTVIGFHKNGGAATETDTHVVGATTVVTFSYSSSTFSKDDRLSISVDPTNDPNNVNLTCHWVFDTST